MKNRTRNTRREQIIRLLDVMPQSALMIAEELEMQRSAVYTHLTDLMRAGVVTIDRRGWCFITEMPVKFYDLTEFYKKYRIERRRK